MLAGLLEARRVSTIYYLLSTSLGYYSSDVIADD